MQSILKHIFNKNTLQDIPVETLQQLTVEYPLFAFGHFLLSKKLREGNDQAFQESFQKTALYFHNPLWLLSRLQGNDISVQAEPSANGLVPANPSGEGEDEDFSSHDLIEEVVLHQETAYGTPEETLSDQVRTTESNHAVIRTEAFNEPYSHNHNGRNDSIAVDENNKTTQGSTSAVALEEPPGVEKLEQEQEKGPEQKEKLVFQAYHTVDYFASQGIRLGTEIQADDKLGKQLKSFTEWLKTMRRLPEATIEEVLDKPGNHEIEQIAAHSLEEKEVVTEAMAEVLLKQGKNDRASEIYHKLSLINPRKSAYFAARIEELKQH
jgi:hypothetical protein